MPNVRDAGVLEKVFAAWNLRYGVYVHLVPDETVDSCTGSQIAHPNGA